MTEQALLPGAAGVEDTSSGNRRALILALGAGAVALLVAVYFLFFTGGSSDDSLGAGPVALPKPAAKTAPKSTAKKPAAKKVVPATFTGVHARDPFKPLIDPPPPAPVEPVVTDPGTSSGGPVIVAPAQTLHLTSLTAGAVKVEVNSTPYAPKVGDKFATYFQLLKLQGTSCATFLYGDESFDLCKGNSVTKQ